MKLYIFLVFLLTAHIASTTCAEFETESQITENGISGSGMHGRRLTQIASATIDRTGSLVAGVKPTTITVGATLQTAATTVGSHVLTYTPDGNIFVAGKGYQTTGFSFASGSSGTCTGVTASTISTTTDTIPKLIVTIGGSGCSIAASAAHTITITDTTFFEPLPLADGGGTNIKVKVDSTAGSDSESTVSSSAITTVSGIYATSISYSTTALDADNEITIAWTSNTAIAENDQIIITGLSGTQTANNANFVISGDNAANYDDGTTASKGAWVNSGTLTLDSVGVIAAFTPQLIRITLKNGLSKQAATTVTFQLDDKSASATATTTVENGGGLKFDDIPLIYYIKSECRVGGLKAGALANCDEGSTNLCKTCTGANGFVRIIGLQSSTSECLSTSTVNDQFRCDVTSYADTSLDVAVNVNGNFGTLVCGAFDESNSGSTTNGVNLMQDPDPLLISKNSIYVDEISKHKDQVISLTNLASDTEYEIFCHMDDGEMSPMLRVFTDTNDRLWGDSFVPGSTIATSSPGTLTLTFYHGKALIGGNTIKLTAFSGTSTDIFSSAPSCTATTNGVSLDITGHTAIVYSSDLLTITLNGASAAGAKIQVICNSNLEANPATSGTTSSRIKYSLQVTNHPITLNNRHGWKSTSS